MKKQLIKKIESRDATIGIVGLGYVGLPLASEFLKENFKVIGFDIDETKISFLQRGKSYINHMDGKEFKNFFIKDKFMPTSDFNFISECDAVVIRRINNNRQIDKPNFLSFTYFNNFIILLSSFSF